MTINRFKVLLFFVSFSFNLDFESVRFLGLGANYSTISGGYHASKTNPATLSSSDGLKINLFSTNFGISNNLFNLNKVNDINGSSLDDPYAVKYYPKSLITDAIKNNGWLFSVYSNTPIPLMNLSYKSYSLSSQSKFFLDFKIPDILLNTVLEGNTLGEKLSINANAELMAVNETCFTKSFDLNEIKLGIGVKYLLGLYYLGLEEVKESYFLTDSTSFNAKGYYLAKQGIGGSGVAVDLGLLTSETESGWKFGFSLNNLFGTVKWSSDSFIRQKLEPTLKSSLENMYLRQGESFFIKFLLDSLNATRLTDVDFSDLVSTEMIKVIRLQDTTGLNIEASNLIAISENDFLIKSDSLTNAEFDQSIQKPFKTVYPKYFHLGFSKRTQDDIHFHFDLSAGFSKSIGGYDNWLLAFGSEFLRFKWIDLRSGLAVGGKHRLSFSLGLGLKLYPVNVDLGLVLNNALSINSMKGLTGGLDFSLQF